MSQLHQPNVARHILLARQGHNKANGDGDGNNGGFLPNIPPPSSSTSTSSSPSSTPTATSPERAPPPSSSTSKQSSASPPVQSTTPPPPPSVTKTSSTSSSTSTSTSSLTSKTTSTTVTSSTTSSSTRSTSSVPKSTTISTHANPIASTGGFTPTISLENLSSTATDGVVPTTSATSSASSVGSNLSAGSIVGAVVGVLVGLALLGFLVAFILRRYRQSRRRALRDSDFGTTFRRSLFVTPRSTVMTPDMTETDHDVGPSLSVPYPAATAQPPSQVLAAATVASAAATTAASSGGLQERPKYVYGQEPSQQWQHDDSASDIAHGGAYSSQPQVQSAYNAEAYGSYAKYEDVSNGVVGGVPAGTAVYQDAQRAYQGQQGYDQSHYATYDQSQYTGYDQQQQYAAYDYSQQHQAYAMGSNHAGAGAHANAYGGI